MCTIVSTEKAINKIRNTSVIIILRYITGHARNFSIVKSCTRNASAYRYRIVRLRKFCISKIEVSMRSI